jgi:hypothetical protein
MASLGVLILYDFRFEHAALAIGLRQVTTSADKLNWHCQCGGRRFDPAWVR